MSGKLAIRPQVPAEGSAVIEQRPRRLAAVRRRVRAIPGAERAYVTAYEATREGVSALYALRDRLSRRPAGQDFAGQSVPRWVAAGAPPLGETAPAEGVARLPPPGAELRVVRADADAREARDAVLTANVLRMAGVGPRAYDAGLLPSGGAGLVLEGSEPAEPGPETDRVEAEVRRLIEGNRLAVTGPGWMAPEHFRRPLAAPDEVRYYGLEHVTVVDRDRVLADALADDARAGLHFGREIAVRGGRFIYQSVPAAGASGRRDTARRWALIASLLRAAGGVRDRVVLDVGCNAGMMLATALADGAAWGLGWDLPDVVPHSERLLLSLGCTRFDLAGAALDRDYDLTADVPAFVAPQLEGSVVFYLAVRHHIGFLESLRDIPWSHMVYEGGETETAARLDESLEELRAFCDVTVLSATDFRDGETKPRPVALLRRDG